jgi:hypothetical protein
MIMGVQIIGWRRDPDQLLRLMYAGKFDILSESYRQLQIGVAFKLTLSIHVMVLCYILTQAGSSSNDRALRFGAYFKFQHRYEILSLSKNFQIIPQSFQPNSGIAAICSKLFHDLFL